MRTALLFFCLIGLLPAVLANNITVSNTSLNGQNTTQDFTLINFDVAWENSWRTSTNENNYDGAWIFVKFRKNGTTDWRHCTINATGHANGAGSTFFIPADGKGAFIHRAADGIGNVNFTGNQLRWNYGADGLLDNETVEIRVFALEMVYIPQGSFQLGSGGTETKTFKDGSGTTPYLVASNNTIPLGTAAGNLNANGAGLATGTIPATFPKGFNAFWIMKYEISQQQYADFLNHIDAARATFNAVTSILTGTHPAITAPQPERAIGYLNTTRMAAHADWSGLRPMTELEFEKASRGYNTPAVPNEYAWGNTQVFPLGSANDPGLATEMVNLPANANAAINNQYANPVRVGLFARSNGSTRAMSGSTYYGVMNMGDNIHEICITVLNPVGRNFSEATHGDGYLSASGATDIAAWSDFNAYGQRGSAYNSVPDYARTSDRTNVNIYPEVYYADAVMVAGGGRLVRTAQ